ncbi:rhomboid family intramembrane serine protease [Hymenobacter sp. HD11105]
MDSDDLFTHKTDAELFYLARQAQRFPPPVVQAAVRELQRRGLVPDEVPTPPSPAPSPLPDESTGRLVVRSLRAMLWPAGSFFITPLLLDLNLLVYALLAFSAADPLAPSGQELVAWGSNFSPLTLHGQPWRLLTSCFLHGGVAHLLLNGLGLLFLGAMLEPLLGRVRLLGGFLVCGVGGSLASLWWNMTGVNSVGASGAIFGLYGLLLALLFTRAVPFDRTQRRTMLWFVFYLMISGLVGSLGGNIDHAAHVGGLITGVLVGVLLGRGRLQKAKNSG